MNKTFKWCVDLLVSLAAKLHMTYEEVNIWTKYFEKYYRVLKPADG